MMNKVGHLLLISVTMFLNSCVQTPSEFWNFSNIEIPAKYIGYTAEESFYSPILQQEWKYTVYYPAGYDTTKKYPVIYLLHGSYGSHSDWKNMGEMQMIMDRSIAAKKIPSSLVIMPDGLAARYTDVPSTNMRTAFEKDLFPYVETNFSTLNKKKSSSYRRTFYGGIWRYSLCS